MKPRRPRCLYAQKSVDTNPENLSQNERKISVYDRVREMFLDTSRTLAQEGALLIVTANQDTAFLNEIDKVRFATKLEQLAQQIRQGKRGAV